MALKRATGLPALLLIGAGSLPAQAAESAIVMQILNGQQLYIEQKQALVKERAAAPQVVSTRQSRGQLAFNTGAAARINRNSVMRLGSSCFLMEKGQILVSGKQNGCTRSARMDSRTAELLQGDAALAASSLGVQMVRGVGDMEVFHVALATAEIGQGA